MEEIATQNGGRPSYRKWCRSVLPAPCLWSPLPGAAQAWKRRLRRHVIAALAMEPPDTRALLPSPVETPDPLLPREAVSSPLPNLTPRHQELIPTPCGPIKPWAELSSPVKIYFCITIISLLSIIGLTIENLVQQKDEDFPVSLIQLIGVVFCIYYLSRGILQENRQELSVFILSIALVMLRSVVNFTVLPARQKPKLLARFVLILMVGAFDMICAAVLMQSDSRMAFRVGGALESLQAQYFMLNLCFSMLTFDLQAQLCLSVLLLTSSRGISALHSVVLAVGILWAVLKVTCGILAILKELKPLVWIFLVQNLPEVAYLAYLLYKVVTEWGQGNSYALEAAIITCSCISVGIKSVLFGVLFHVYRSFGQGLRERSEYFWVVTVYGSLRARQGCGGPSVSIIRSD
ncbi:hypothetical protein JRQ81_009780 [Phrynocephalus forsythii]|uniref:DUF7789 domain-containing protein n=1 Tax=Phrynocephalus forsythii TaxID=171643 RepID=A0A9Q1ARG2_9SAUR|nr:hypothetical protein JRQ81_009780 [Phrynocephalus forsythii]